MIERGVLFAKRNQKGAGIVLHLSRAEERLPVAGGRERVLYAAPNRTYTGVDCAQCTYLSCTITSSVHPPYLWYVYGWTCRFFVHLENLFCAIFETFGTTYPKRAQFTLYLPFLPFTDLWFDIDTPRLASFRFSRKETVVPTSIQRQKRTLLHVPPLKPRPRRRPCRPRRRPSANRPARRGVWPPGR